MIDAPLGLAALIAGAAFTAFWLESRIPALSRIGSSLIALALGATLSNTGLVPGSSPTYEFVAGPLTLLAITWLLLAVNVSDLRLAGPRMIGAFGLAVTGTVLGALTGAFIFADALGDNSWRLAGTLTGTYSGGSLNFVAVGRALELPTQLFTGATAADALLTGVWLAVTIALPGVIGRFYRPVGAEATAVPATGPRATADAASTDGDAPDDARPTHPFFARMPISALDVAKLLTFGLVLLALAEGISTVLGGLAAEGRVPEVLGAVPTVLWLTTLALIVGHVPAWKRPRGALILGSVSLHLFFVVIGIWSRVADIVAVGPAVFLYVLLVVAVHGVFVFGVGRLLRLDVGSLAVGSQAAVGGPASALAVAVARRWSGLVLPGVIVGLLGYALGTYVGLAVAHLARAAL